MGKQDLNKINISTFKAGNQKVTSNVETGGSATQKAC